MLIGTRAWGIKEWDARWENAQSRKYKRPEYIPLRVEQNSLNFRELMTYAAGVLAFGHFMALVELAATMPARGVLARSDRALTPEHCAGLIGTPADLMRASWEILTKIGWLVPLIYTASGWNEVVSESPSAPPSTRPFSPNAVEQSPSAPDSPPAESPSAPPSTRPFSPNDPAAPPVSDRCASRERARTEESRGEESSEEQRRAFKTAASAAGRDAALHEIPLLIDTPGFRAAWDQWLQHRREKRNPVTPTAAREQLSKLAAMGSDAAIRAIKHSVSNGWTGVFEEKKNGHIQHNSHRATKRESEYASDLGDLPRA